MGISNVNLAIQHVDIDNNQNVNVTIAGCAFGQCGDPERWGEIIDVPIQFSGGLVTFAAA